MSVEKNLKIEGMTCGHCAMSVTKELLKLPGAADVKVDFAGATAQVTVDESVSDADLTAAVDEAGYKLVAVS